MHFKDLLSLSERTTIKDVTRYLDAGKDIYAKDLLLGLVKKGDITKADFANLSKHKEYSNWFDFFAKTNKRLLESLED